MRVLTLDQSTRTGWCIADEDTADPRSPAFKFGSFRAPKRDDPGERLTIFRDGLVDVIEKHKPEIAAYETPFFPVGDAGKQQEGRGAKFSPKTIKFLLHLEGVLIETTARYGIPTQSFASSSWRVTALGMGRAPFGSPHDFFKKLMIKRAKALGYDVADDNEGDAIGIMIHMLYGAPATERRQGDLLSMATAKL